MRRLMIGLTLAFAVAGPVVFAQTANERNRAMTQYKLGFENMRAEAWEEAAKSFQSAIDIDSNFEMAYYMLGRVRMAQKQFANAVAAFSKSRDIYLSSAGRHFANAQEAQRYRREKMVDLDEVLRQLRQGPQNMQVQDQIRQLEERKRLLQENIQQGNNMTIDASVPSFVSLSLGSAHYRTGSRTEAEKYYKARPTTILPSSISRPDVRPMRKKKLPPPRRRDSECTRS
jgi:tetratricopeptide (TPR) repeat protein